MYTEEIRFSVNHTHSFVSCVCPVYFTFSSCSCTCIYVSNIHVPRITMFYQGLLAFKWTLPHSISSYTQQFLNINRKTSQVKIFHSLKIVQIKVFDFPKLDRNLIVLLYFLFILKSIANKYTCICRDPRFYDSACF